MDTPTQPSDDDAPMTLDEAARLLLRGAVSAATLRVAIGRRDLTCERIGRRVMVTPADVRAWRKRCRVQAEERPAASEGDRGRVHVGPSMAGALAAQRAATRASLAALSKLPNRNALPKRLRAAT